MKVIIFRLKAQCIFIIKFFVICVSSFFFDKQIDNLNKFISVSIFLLKFVIVKLQLCKQSSLALILKIVLALLFFLLIYIRQQQ